MKKYALVSLYNKDKIQFLCKILNKHNIEIISTGSTSFHIKKIGYKCNLVSKLTKFKEIFDGRIKTLHHKIHASLLFNRKKNKHLKEFGSLNFPKIDFVIVNLYPFESAKKNSKKKSKLIEMIDIGGPALLRSSAKNFDFVTTITDINDYNLLDRNLSANNGSTSLSFRKKMAAKAFKTTSIYDKIITNWLQKDNNFLFLENNKKNLRYGENPHQRSFFYSHEDSSPYFESIIQGKQLSYNNIVDINSAFECVSEFNKPTCVIVKHNNPCGVSTHSKINLAFLNAKNADPISAFGGIVALNRPVNHVLANNLISNFFEVILAPSFTKKAIIILNKKNKLILVNTKNFKKDNKLDIKSVSNGYLIQEKNNILIQKKDLKCVSNKISNSVVVNDLIFALKVCKHVKSNAIVLAKNQKTISIGAGQMSRINAIKIALSKINNKKIHFVTASDGFFPFVDSIKVLIKSRCKAIVQPQGSINDKKVISFANKNKFPLYFINHRLFKH